MSISSEKIVASFGVAILSVFILGGVIASVTSANNTKDSQSQAQQVQQTQQKQTDTERKVTETKKEVLSYNTKTVDDDSIEYGKTMVRTVGQYGEKTYTYEVVYKDDEEISRELIKEEVTKKPVDEVIANGTKITWHCVDVTSYNKNPYDDNKCTSSTGEVRYVSDSQARALDSSYSPGKSGHSYYNSK